MPDNPKRKWAQKKPTKPPEYLIVMRNVARQPAADDPPKHGLYAIYRAMLEKEPDKFLDRLHKAEVEHKRALVTYKKTRNRALHGHDGVDRSGRPAPPAAEPAAPDLGEEKALELLEKLLREKPWEKFKE